MMMKHLGGGRFWPFRLESGSPPTIICSWECRRQSWFYQLYCLAIIGSLASLQKFYKLAKFLQTTRYVSDFPVELDGVSALQNDTLLLKLAFGAYTLGQVAFTG